MRRTLQVLGCVPVAPLAGLSLILVALATVAYALTTAALRRLDITNKPPGASATRSTSIRQTAPGSPEAPFTSPGDADPHSGHDLPGAHPGTSYPWLPQVEKAIEAYLAEHGEDPAALRLPLAWVQEGWGETSNFYIGRWWHRPSEGEIEVFRPKLHGLPLGAPVVSADGPLVICAETVSEAMRPPIEGPESSRKDATVRPAPATFEQRYDLSHSTGEDELDVRTCCSDRVESRPS